MQRPILVWSTASLEGDHNFTSFLRNVDLVLGPRLAYLALEKL